MGNAPLKVEISVEDNGFAGPVPAVDCRRSKDKQPLPVVVAGCTFRGKVCFHVHRRSLEASCSAGLNLELVGIETATVPFGDERMEDSYSFFHMKHPLVSFPSSRIGVEPGRYEYPFEIALPAHLAPTMFVRHGEHTEDRCQVRYELQVRLQPRPTAEISQHLLLAAPGECWNRHGCRQELHVVGPPRPSHEASSVVAPLLMPIQKEPVRANCLPFFLSCGCRKAGTMILAGQVSHDNVAPGDMMRVAWKAYNNSSAHVEQVYIQLIERIRWKAFDQTQVVERVVSKDPLCFADHNSFPDLQPRCPSQEQERRRRGGGEEEENDEEMAAILTEQGFNVVFWTVPDTVRESYRGTLIEVSHFVVIQVAMENWWFCPLPETSCRIRIHSPSSAIDNMSDNPPPPTTQQPEEAVWSEVVEAQEALPVAENWLDTGGQVVIPVEGVATVE